MSEPLVMELMMTTDVLLNEIRSGATQTQVASTYGLAIMSSDPTDWPKVNAAIRERWSVSAVERVKKKAWKMVKSGGGA